MTTTNIQGVEFEFNPVIDSTDNLPDFNPEEFKKDMSHYISGMLEDLFKRIPLSAYEVTEPLAFRRATVNHACIWNKISNVGKKCMILARSTTFSLVHMLDTDDISLYRNEDLTQTQPQTP